MKKKYIKKLSLIIVFSIFFIFTFSIFFSLFFIKLNIPNIIYVHDTELKDNSLNEYSYKGINNSIENQEEKYYSSEFKTTSNTSQINSLVKSFSNDGTDMFIFAGYANDLWLENNYDLLPKDVFFVYLDDGNKKYFSDQYQNIHSIYFETSEASFVAGLISSIYLTTIYENNNDWIIGAWGGLPITPVINILSGFESGINFFNENILKTNEKIKLIPPSNGWYSGSFDSGNEGLNAASFLIDAGAKILFPVAGNQTSDAIAQINKVNALEENIMIIGVDSDIKNIYPESKQYILTSVIKNFEMITEKISDQLWNYYNSSNMVTFEENDYIANWKNGGVGITDLNSDINLNSYNLFLEDKNDIFIDKNYPPTFIELIKIIFSNPNLNIENNSPTFN